MLTQMRRPRTCLFLAGLLTYGICCSGCGTVQYVQQKQPLFVKPVKAKVQPMSVRDLNALRTVRPVVHAILLENVRAWKLELKQWDATADFYNEGVRKRNEQARERLTE